MRKLVVLVLFFLLGLEGLPASAGTRGDEADFVNRINALRTSHAVVRLRIDANLTKKARKWAGGMAARDHIWHSNLADGVTAGWQKLGENVGMGGSVATLHEAFVKSPRHYDNLVDPVFRYVGLGVVIVNGKVFVSEVFMQRRPNNTSASAANAESKVGPTDDRRRTPRTGLPSLRSAGRSRCAARFERRCSRPRPGRSGDRR